MPGPDGDMSHLCGHLWWFPTENVSKSIANTKKLLRHFAPRFKFHLTNSTHFPTNVWMSLHKKEHTEEFNQNMPAKHGSGLLTQTRCHWATPMTTMPCFPKCGKKTTKLQPFQCSQWLHEPCPCHFATWGEAGRDCWRAMQLSLTQKVCNFVHWQRVPMCWQSSLQWNVDAKELCLELFAPFTKHRGLQCNCGVLPFPIPQPTPSFLSSFLQPFPPGDDHGFVQQLPTDNLVKCGCLHLVSAYACLGMVLVWTRTTCMLWEMAALFGLTGLPANLWLHFGKRILLNLLSMKDDAKLQHAVNK